MDESWDRQTIGFGLGDLCKSYVFGLGVVSGRTLSFAHSEIYTIYWLKDNTFANYMNVHDVRLFIENFKVAQHEQNQLQDR